MRIKLRNTWQLFRKAFRGYFWHILFLGILGFLSGLLGGIGIGALIPLLSFLTGKNAAAPDAISSFLIKVFGYFAIPYRMESLLIIIVVLVLCRAIFLLVFNYVSTRLYADYKKRTMSELFSRLLQSRWQYFLTKKAGYIQNILIQDVHFSAKFLEITTQALLAFITTLTFIFFALTISFPTTLLAFFIGIIFLVIFQPLFRKARTIAKQFLLEDKRLFQFIVEHLGGMRAIKTLAAEEGVYGRGAALFTLWTELDLKKIVLRAFAGTAAEPLSVIFIAALFLFSYQRPDFHFEIFAATMILIQRIFVYFEAGRVALHAMYEHAPHINQVIAFREKLYQEAERDSGTQPFAFAERIHFRDVFFRYTPEKEVLSGVNFSINKGEIVGLIGPSGSGKTTIADLFMRLLEPTSGRIFMDGVESGQIRLREWRNTIGYVSQDIFLLHDTIAQNIKFYDEFIGDRAMEEAAQNANILDFIKGLKEGFHTVVGERGVMLSLGQRQRIAMARVLARRPQILILDEATSALDNESEVLIQRTIEALRGQITVFIIAHRLSTVMGVDRLIVLGEGKITEEGRPQELLLNPQSYFYRLYHLREESGIA